MMQTGTDASRDVTAQLCQVGAQIHDLISMLETGHDCDQAMTRLAEISHALDRAGFWLLTTQLQHCLAASSSSDTRGRDLEHLEKLFLSLA
jgi:DNA-binding FrmR family transcriptional regulator